MPTPEPPRPPRQLAAATLAALLLMLLMLLTTASRAATAGPAAAPSPSPAAERASTPPAGPAPATSPAAGHWWTSRQAGLVGGIGGSLIGLVGGTLGALAGCGGPRPAVMGLLSAMAAAGILALLGGAAALVDDQPRHVWYPLCLAGSLCVGLGLGLRPSMRARYDALELQRMRAADI